jgi:hypothetical protein
VGFPGETEKTIGETMDFVKSSGLDTALFMLFTMRTPDIPVADSRARYALRGSGYKWSHSTMNSAEARKGVRRCIMDVALKMETPLVGSEISLAHAGVARLGRGGAAAGMRTLGLYRDYYRGRESGDRELELKALAALFDG